MAKKLILCLDGTSNRYSRDNTNVVKLAALLDKTAANQLLYYQPGIGTIPPPTVFSRTWKWVLTRLDLAFAILLSDHVQDAYRFLMRYYETGDQIFIFGFSRGAYTARVLAGMLCKVGLLARGNEELVPFAWAQFANHEEEEKDPQERQRKAEETLGFRNTFSRTVAVDLLGLWDTVSSVRYAWRDQHFPHTFDNPIVTKVRHAMALDEHRAYFRQNLWKEPARPGQDVLQVWFVGVHCDDSWRNQWIIPLGHRRQIAETAKIDPGVFKRMDADPDYEPLNLPDPIGHGGVRVRLGVSQETKRRIMARMPWNDTGIDVDIGEQYDIKAEGVWIDSTIKCTARGYVTSEAHWYLRWILRLYEKRRRLPGQNWFALIGAVDRDETNSFPIGDGLSSWTPAARGQLTCFANDVPGFYGNNHRFVTLTIKRVA